MKQEYRKPLREKRRNEERINASAVSDVVEVVIFLSVQDELVSKEKGKKIGPSCPHRNWVKTSTP